MYTMMQKSFLVKGATCSGKDFLPKEFRNRGLEIYSYGIGNHLRDLIKERKTSRKVCTKTMNSGGLLPDDLIEHIMSEQIQLIGNNHPFFGIGLIRTLPQVDITLRVLRENGFAPPTIIHLNYSIEYCRQMRLSRLTEEEARDDSDLATCERRWKDYYDTEAAIIAECKNRGLRIYSISDGDKMDHIDRYIQDLGLSELKVRAS